MAKRSWNAGTVAPVAQSGPQGDARADDDRTTVLFLALFLAVLVFFILLTALSSFEPVRTANVLHAVGERFSGSAEGDAPVSAMALPGTAPAGAIALSDEAYFGAIEDALAAFRMDGTAQRADGALVVLLPADRLFLPRTAALRGDVQPAVDALAAAVARGTASSRRHVEVAAGARDAQRDTLTARRAAVIAAGFASHTGAEAVGLKLTGAPDGTIKLLFYATGRDQTAEAQR